MVRVAAKLVVIFLLVYAGVYLWYGRLEKRLLSGTAKPVKIQAEKTAAIGKQGSKVVEPEAGTQNYQVIVTRNIFQAALESVVEAPEEVVEEVIPTSLNLTLLGTVTGNDRDARAIIVDNKDKQQDIYQIGDALQGAFIESIGRGKVTLDVNGKIEALLIKDREGGGPGAPNVPLSTSRIEPQNKPEKSAERKVPKVRPHRRISFRQDPELPEAEPEIIDDEAPDKDQDQGLVQPDDTAVEEGPPPVE